MAYAFVKHTENVSNGNTVTITCTAGADGDKATAWVISPDGDSGAVEALLSAFEKWTIERRIVEFEIKTSPGWDGPAVREWARLSGYEGPSDRGT